MKILIKTSKNLKLNSEVEESIKTKMESVLKYNNDIVKIYVTVDKDTNSHRHGDIFKVSIDADIPGNDLHASSIKNEIILALNDAKKDLISLLTKHKEKSKSKQLKNAQKTSNGNFEE